MGWALNCHGVMASSTAWRSPGFVEKGVSGDVLTNAHARMLFTILSAVSEAERERVLDVKCDQDSRSHGMINSIRLRTQTGSRGSEALMLMNRQSNVCRVYRFNAANHLTNSGTASG